MSRLRRWFLTENNPLEGQPQETAASISSLRYAVYQFEQGENETLHYHMYVEFHKALTFNTMKKLFPRANIQPVKSRQASIKYCTKSKTRVDGPYELGESTQQGFRTDLQDAQILIDEGLTEEQIYRELPTVSAKYPKFIEKQILWKLEAKAKQQYLDKVSKKVVVLYGPTRSGKTSYVYRKHDINDIYHFSLSGGTKGSIWFDHYKGQPVLLLDDFYGNMKWTTLLNLLDIYPVKMQYKGGTTFVPWTHIYITSNSHPTEWYRYGDNMKYAALMSRISKIIDTESGFKISKSEVDIL